MREAATCFPPLSPALSRRERETVVAPRLPLLAPCSMRLAAQGTPRTDSWVRPGSVLGSTCARPGSVLGSPWDRLGLRDEPRAREKGRKNREYQSMHKPPRKISTTLCTNAPSSTRASECPDGARRGGARNKALTQPLPVGDGSDSGFQRHGRHLPRVPSTRGGLTSAARPGMIDCVELLDRPSRLLL